MSEETVLTPITPEEGASAPPKVTPSTMTAAASAPTVKLKPVIRKPLIRKPVIGGAKPVTLKPASGTPPPPAAVPEAAAETVAAPAVPEAKPAEPQLKSITSPIAAQAVLRKTGIVAEGRYFHKYKYRVCDENLFSVAAQDGARLENGMAWRGKN